MTQLVARIDGDLAALVDELVASGAVESRSDAVRRGLRMLVDRHRRLAVAKSIIAGYEKEPQSEVEVGWPDETTTRMIGDEPW